MTTTFAVIVGAGIFGLGILAGVAITQSNFDRIMKQGGDTE